MDEGHPAVFSGSCAYHAFFLDKKGILYGIGNNSYGQLGFKVYERVGEPVALHFFDRMKIVEVACGWHHSLVLVEGGDVYAFGDNSFGQLGVPRSHNRDNGTPVLITKFRNMREIGDEKVISVSCGDLSSYCLTSEGKIFSFGRNTCGQLGDGDFEHRSNPVEVVAHSGPDSMFDRGSCERMKFASISSGGTHAAAVGSDDRVYTWGSNSHGQLGRTGDGSIAKQVDLKLCPSSPSFCFNGWGDGLQREHQAKIKEVRCGYHHVVALTSGLLDESNTAVFVWGDNEYGQLGLGNHVKRSEPRQQLFFDGLLLRRLSVGSWHTVFCCRYRNRDIDEQIGGGVLQNDDFVEQNDPLESKITDGFTLKSQERSVRIIGFGKNDEGQLGPKNELKSHATPFLIDDPMFQPTSFIDVVCGGDHTILVSSTDNCYAFGDNLALNIHMEELPPYFVFSGVGTKRAASRLRRKLLEYILREQEEEPSTRTTDACLTVMDSEGNSMQLMVNEEFIKARFLRNVTELSLHCDQRVFPTKNELLFRIYSGRKAGGSLGSLNPICKTMEMLYSERKSGGDIVLKSTKFPFDCHFAHKFVLVCGLNYFRAMFKGDWVESRSSEISVDMPLGGPFETYLHYIYTGKLSLGDTGEAAAILKFVNYFDEDGIEDVRLRKLCENFIKK